MVSPRSYLMPCARWSYSLPGEVTRLFRHVAETVPPRPFILAPQLRHIHRLRGLAKPSIRQPLVRILPQQLPVIWIIVRVFRCRVFRGFRRLVRATACSSMRLPLAVPTIGPLDRRLPGAISQFEQHYFAPLLACRCLAGEPPERIPICRHGGTCIGDQNVSTPPIVSQIAPNSHTVLHLLRQI